MWAGEAAMAKCSFCGGNMPEIGGRMFAKNDGRIFYFCRHKCWMNWGMGREGKNVKWTETARKFRVASKPAPAAVTSEADVKK